jgi:diguanylate cyclase (GGDEF)-like protein
MRKVLLFIISFIFLAASAHSQTPQSIYDYDIKQWTAVDGLSNNSVRAITQDRLGYLWVGTLEGLNRFDGHRFESFSTKQNKQLIGNAITQLYSDQQGYIWIGTMSGLSGLNPVTLKFDRFPILGEVSDIAEVSENEIWVAADNLFRVKDNVVSRVEEIKEPVSQILVTPENIWVTSNKFLYKLDRDGKLEKLPLSAEIAQHPIYDLQWENDNIHLASEQGYFHINAAGEVKRCDLPSEPGHAIYQLHHDKQGGDWASGYDKLFHRHQGQDWQIISRDELGNSTRFSDIFEDSRQNVWLGSFSDGLYRASRGKIKRVLSKQQQEMMVRSIAVTANNELILTSTGRIGVLDKKQNYHDLPLDRTRALGTIQDLQREGKDWLLATDSGPYRYTPTTGGLSVLTNELLGVKTKVIKPRLAGGYWIATNLGLFEYQDSVLKPSVFNAEFESTVVTYVEERADKLLIGTTRGAYQFSQGRLSRLGLGTPLTNGFISAMLELRDGTLLVATIDDGLFVRHFNGKWTDIDTANGLPFEPIVTLYHHEQSGYVWASTLKGIFRFHPADIRHQQNNQSVFEQVLTPYDRQLGTSPGRCCNGSGHSKVAFWQNQLWYPTLKGLVAVPVSLKVNRDEDNIPLIQQVVTNQSYALLPEQTRLVLETGERNLSIHYTEIDFLKPLSLEFRYKLQGFDSQWHQVGSRREAIYTNIPAGTYQFILQSRSYNQNWEVAGQRTLELVVPRRFDETIIYRGLWLLLALGVLYGLIWLFRRNNLSKEYELTKLVKQRTLELENSNIRLNDLNEQLSHLTLKDTLTGLRNRRFMFEQLPKDIEHYQRNRELMLAQNKCIALIHLDLDNFKSINDKYGNSAGDSLLQQISGLLIRETRGSDYVVRYAGEEFMLVLRDVPQDLVREFAVRLNELISGDSFMLPDGRVVPVNCSIGYSVYPLELLGGQLISWEVSLQLAELALFHVKHNGRNGVATISFDKQVDAFEFEDSKHIEAQVEKLLADGVAWFDMSRTRKTYN